MAYARPTVMNAIPYNGYVYPDKHVYSGDPQSGCIIKHKQAFKLLTMAHRYASIIDPHWHSARQPGAHTWSI